MSKTVLQLEEVTRHFGRHPILRSIDLTIAAGERIALRGVNGSGKTTLLRIAAGTLRPTTGTVVRASTAYLAQDAPVYRELSPVDHLRFADKVYGQSWDQRYAIIQLTEAGLARAADRPAGTLSRGQRQRLAALMTLRSNAELLLLDEPWTALDDEGAAWLTNHLDSTQAAVLTAIHGDSPFTPDRTVTLEGGHLA